MQNTHEGAFIFFAVWSLGSTFFVWFFVPETTNRTLEDMDAVFGDNAGASDENEKAGIRSSLRTTRSSRRSATLKEAQEPLEERA